MDIAAHLAYPEISLEKHVESRVVEVGQSLERRTAIYLDTKFWIVCATAPPTVIPKYGKADAGSSYEGSAILKISSAGPNRLSGNYFTSRQGTGHFDLSR